MAAKASSQICCSTYKSEELTGSEGRVCSCWRVGGIKTSICCLHHTSNSFLGQSKFSPNFGKEINTANNSWQHLSGYSDVQSRRNLISGCLYRSLRGNKARFNPSQLSPQWPLKSYNSSHLTKRNPLTYFERICYKYFMQNYFLCFVMHNVMFIPVQQKEIQVTATLGDVPRDASEADLSLFHVLPRRIMASQMRMWEHPNPAYQSYSQCLHRNPELPCTFPSCPACIQRSTWILSR